MCAEFGQPPVEHFAVDDGGADVVVVRVFAGGLVVGERRLREVVAGDALDIKAEADFFAFAEAEAPFGLVAFEVEVFGASEAHGGWRGAAQAMQGEMAFVVIACKASDEIEGGALLDEGKRLDARGDGGVFLVLVGDV